MSEHCEHAPSAFERIAACPATVQRSRGMPNLPNKYSIEGSRAHDVARVELERAFGWHDDKDKGFYWPDVDEEMRAAVELYVETVTSVCDPVNDQVWVEQKVNLAPFNPPVPIWGTSDAIIYKPLGAHLLCFDFKYGRGIPVEVRGNYQLRIYCGGAIATLGPDRPVNTVDNYIVQPRCAHPEGPVRGERITGGDILMDMADVFQLAARTLLPNPVAIPGDHCKWCPAKAVCPEFRASALSVAQDEFGVSLSETVSDPPQLPQPIHLSDNDLGMILDRGKLFEAWLDGVRQYAHHRAEQGFFIPGWKLVLKRATRRWRDEQEAEATLRMSLGEDAELYSAKLKSPAQLEKEIGKPGVRAFHDLIVSESSGTTLAPDYDARTSIDAPHSAAADFEALP